MESNLAERTGLSVLMTLLGMGLVLCLDALTGHQLARWVVGVLIT